MTSPYRTLILGLHSAGTQNARVLIQTDHSLHAVLARPYPARHLDGEQPEWLLREVIKIESSSRLKSGGEQADVGQADPKPTIVAGSVASISRFRSVPDWVQPLILGQYIHKDPYSGATAYRLDGGVWQVAIYVANGRAKTFSFRVNHRQLLETDEASIYWLSNLEIEALRDGRFKGEAAQATFLETGLPETEHLSPEDRLPVLRSWFWQEANAKLLDPYVEATHPKLGITENLTWTAGSSEALQQLVTDIMRCDLAFASSRRPVRVEVTCASTSVTGHYRPATLKVSPTHEGLAAKTNDLLNLALARNLPHCDCLVALTGRRSGLTIRRLEIVYDISPPTGHEAIASRRRLDAWFESGEKS